MAIRAKFHIESVLRRSNSTGVIDAEVIEARPVYGDTPENKEWSKWTPTGRIALTISNPEAFGKLLPGQEVFVDITPVPG